MSLNIVYEDTELLVVHKPAGMATQTARLTEKDLVSECNSYLAKQGKKGVSLGLINRLDQPVEGLVLLGLNKKSTADLTSQLGSGNINKHYYAMVCGRPEIDSGLVADFLLKDAKTNTAMVVDCDVPGAKKAILEYKLIATDGQKSLLDIHLITGRFHQIRVQMSAAGMPLLGDNKYGSEESLDMSAELGIHKVALCAYALSFDQPTTGQRLELEIMPQGKWYQLLNKE